MGLGGPVWHVSVQHQLRDRFARPRPTAEYVERAERVLRGVGDAELGQWVSPGTGNGILHIRRRLSDAERVNLGIEVVDIRGTPEAAERYQAMLRYLPAAYIAPEPY
jgi:hypothetical protein